MGRTGGRAWIPLTTVALSALSVLLSGSAAEHRRALDASNRLDLRSAYLLRATAGEASPVPSSTTARRELERHFDRVLQILQAQTAASIQTALDRLEQAEGTSWRPHERAAWRTRLQVQRKLQLKRLAEYCDHGRFPLNEGHAPRATPIFVDRHDTACAVGHLMRLSGWQDAVAQIAAVNNLVYVPDVTEGPLVDWVLTSGLTQEEAALIQPTYHLLAPPADTTLDKLLDAAASLNGHGVRYGNFTYAAQNYERREDQFEPVGGGELPRPENIGVGSYEGDHVPHGPWGDLFGPYMPDGTHWLVFGAAAETATGGSIASHTTLDRAQEVRIAFDAEVAMPYGMITAVHIADEPSICLGCGRYPSYAIGAEVFAGEQSLGTLVIDADNPGQGEPGGLLLERTLNIPPQRSVRLESFLWNQDFTFTNAYLVEVTVSPDETWIPGDFDLNGIVDRRDVDVWRASLGQPMDRTASFAYGDADGDGDVDGHDLLGLLLNFGRQSQPDAPALAAAVPEPATASLVSLLLACLAVWYIAFQKRSEKVR